MSRWSVIYENFIFFFFVCSGICGSAVVISKFTCFGELLCSQMAALFLPLFGTFVHSCQLHTAKALWLIYLLIKLMCCDCDLIMLLSVTLLQRISLCSRGHLFTQTF